MSCIPFLGAPTSHLGTAAGDTRCIILLNLFIPCIGLVVCMLFIYVAVMASVVVMRCYMTDGLSFRLFGLTQVPSSMETGKE